MKDERVKDWMSKPAVAIEHTASLPEAHHLMLEKNIRRLPVMEDERLVGIITRGDVRGASPSDATSLSIYEINYLLARLPVSRIMTRNPMMVTPDTQLAEAANLMLKNKISGLPVMEGHKLVGVITESDIFRAFVKLMQE